MTVPSRSVKGHWLGNNVVQAQAEAAVDCPVAAAGLLHATQKALGSIEYWREYHGSTPPLYLNYLALIVPRQPLLLSQVNTMR